MWKLKKLLKKQGFTLVELIIVIAIIAVLAVAAFMMLTKWLANSRDSRRLGDVSTIKKALSITFIEKPYYPEPDNKNPILDEEGITMWYQWVFGSGVIEDMDNLQKAPVDPSDGSYFRYAVTTDQKEYQIWAILEKGEEASFLNSTLAANLVASVEWDYDGYATYSSGTTYIVRTPSLLLYSGSSLERSGDNHNLMIPGEELGTVYEIKSVWFTGNPTDLAETIRDTFGLTGVNADKLALTIVKNNSTVTPSAITYADCPFEGGSLSHGASVTRYENETVAYNETCVSEIRTCNNGTISDGTYLETSCSIENALDCNVETKSIWWHTYQVWVITHENSESVNSDTINISEGTQYWTTEFTCTNEILSNGIENGPTTGCNPGYVEDNDICEANECGGGIIANAKTNATSQSFGTNWNYNTTSWVCTYECKEHYKWDGDSCEADSQEVSCGTVPTYAIWNTSNIYTQTWDGDSWEPNNTANYNILSSTEDCRYKCNTWYHTEDLGNTCVLDTRSCVITNGAGSQSWNGTDWDVCLPTVCNIDFYKEGNLCEEVWNGYYSPMSNITRYVCSTWPSYSTYTASWNGIDNCAWGCNLDYYKAGEFCTTVWNGFYSPHQNNNRISCTTYSDTTSRDYTYTSDGNGTDSCTANYTPKCGIDLYESISGTCSAVGLGHYSEDLNNSDLVCTNKPANSDYTTDGNGIDNCSWNCSTWYTNISGSCKATLVWNDISWRTRSNGTNATTCKEYRIPTDTNYNYSGITGSWWYIRNYWKLMVYNKSKYNSI